VFLSIIVFVSAGYKVVNLIFLFHYLNKTFYSPLEGADSEDHHDHCGCHAREEDGVEQLDLLGGRRHQVGIGLGSYSWAETGPAELGHPAALELPLQLQLEALVGRRLRGRGTQGQDRGGDQVAPHLGHLVEDEEESEELDGVDVLARLVAPHLGEGLRDGGEVGALGAPQRSASEAHHQGRRDQGREPRVELGGYVGHVGEQGQRHGQPAAEPTVDGTHRENRKIEISRILWGRVSAEWQVAHA